MMDIEEVSSFESLFIIQDSHTACACRLLAVCIVPFEMQRLLILGGGAIPASMKSESVLVGFMHPVMILQVWFSTGSSFCA